MTADLKQGEIVILEPVVDAGFGKDNKKSDQPNTTQEIRSRQNNRNRVGLTVNQ